MKTTNCYLFAGPEIDEFSVKRALQEIKSEDLSKVFELILDAYNKMDPLPIQTTHFPIRNPINHDISETLEISNNGISQLFRSFVAESLIFATAKILKDICYRVGTLRIKKAWEVQAVGPTIKNGVFWAEAVIEVSNFYKHREEWKDPPLDLTESNKQGIPILDIDKWKASAQSNAKRTLELLAKLGPEEQKLLQKDISFSIYFIELLKLDKIDQFIGNIIGFRDAVSKKYNLDLSNKGFESSKPPLIFSRDN